MSLWEYLVNKYALWLDFGTIDENELHGMGRRIENASESAGALNAYTYLIMDVQLNIQSVHMFLLYIRIKMFMKELHTALFIAPTRVGNSFSPEPARV